MGSQPIQLLKTDGIPYVYQSIKDGNGRDVVKAEVEQLLGELCCFWSTACTSSLSPVSKPAVLGRLPGLRAPTRHQNPSFLTGTFIFPLKPFGGGR